MTLVERTFARWVHPRHTLLATIGSLWAIYFFWLHNWIWALAAILLGEVVGTISTVGVSADNLAQTSLGKIALLHLHPVNLLVQTAGLILLMVGLWNHSGTYIMAALSVILIGHMWGWHKVNEAL